MQFARFTYSALLEQIMDHHALIRCDIAHRQNRADDSECKPWQERAVVAAQHIEIGSIQSGGRAQRGRSRRMRRTLPIPAALRRWAARRSLRLAPLTPCPTLCVGGALGGAPTPC